MPGSRPGRASMTADMDRLFVTGISASSARPAPDRVATGLRGVSHWPAGMVGIAAALFAAFIYAMSSGYPIDGDGATVLRERLPLTLDSLMAPFHQHWNLVPILVYSVFGPSRVVLLTLHVLLAVSTTWFLSKRVGETWALAIGLPLGLLGSAHYDFLSPYQILFSISLLLGLVAVWGTLERRPIVVAVSLMLAVMTSNLGVFLIVALFLWQGRWRELAPATVLYGAWFLTFGRTGLGGDSTPDLLLVVPYTMTAVASSAGLGLGPIVGAFVLGALTRSRPPRAMLAFLVTIVLLFAATSLFRNYGDTAQALTSRYIYLSAFLVAFGLIAAAPKMPDDRRAVWAGAVVAAWNVALLILALPLYAAGRYS